jgi:hypothetical protein
MHRFVRILIVALAILTVEAILGPRASVTFAQPDPPKRVVSEAVRNPPDGTTIDLNWTDLSGRDLSGLDYSARSFLGANLSGADLSSADLAHRRR